MGYARENVVKLTCGAPRRSAAVICKVVNVCFLYLLEDHIDHQCLQILFMTLGCDASKPHVLFLLNLKKKTNFFAHWTRDALNGPFFSLSFQVEDVNDNAPVFVSLPYYAAVQVDAEPGSAIFRVSAVDRDSGLNGEVTYSLKEQHRNFQVICCRFYIEKRRIVLGHSVTRTSIPCR